MNFIGFWFTDVGVNISEEICHELGYIFCFEVFSFGPFRKVETFWIEFIKLAPIMPILDEIFVEIVLGSQLMWIFDVIYEL